MLSLLFALQCILGNAQNGLPPHLEVQLYNVFCSAFSLQREQYGEICRNAEDIRWVVGQHFTCLYSNSSPMRNKDKQNVYGKELSVLITYYIIIFAKLVEVGYCTFQCVSGCPANSTRKL